MHERRRREWLTPFARSLTRQTARKAPSHPGCGKIGRSWRCAPWHRSPGYDQRRAPYDHPDFNSNALSEDLFSGSLKKKPGAGSLLPGYRHPLHRGVIGLLPKHHPTRFSAFPIGLKYNLSENPYFPPSTGAPRPCANTTRSLAKRLASAAPASMNVSPCAPDPRRTRAHRRSQRDYYALSGNGFP